MSFCSRRTPSHISVVLQLPTTPHTHLASDGRENTMEETKRVLYHPLEKGYRYRFGSNGVTVSVCTTTLALNTLPRASR